MAIKKKDSAKSENGITGKAGVTKQIALKLQQGIAYHQAGHLEHAQAKYQEILTLDPKNADALHFSGALAAQTGQLNRAFTLLTLALEQNQNNPFVHFNLGNVLDELGRLDDALTCYTNAIKLKPDYAEAYTNHGIISVGLNQLEDALFCFERVIQLTPKNAEAHANHGKTLKNLGRFEEALRSFGRAMELNPENPNTHYEAGIALAQLERFDEALTSYYKAIALQPDHAEAYSHIGIALRGLGRLNDALDNLDKAVALKNTYADSYSNRGVVLRELGRFDEAVRSYCKAVVLEPENAEIHYNLGNALGELKRFDEALDSYATAIALKSDHVGANFNKSLVQLIKGDYRYGFKEYEWRWQTKQMHEEAAKRPVEVPLWLGDESLAGKTILLFAEQGLGDSIQFSRYASLVKSLGAKVLLKVPNPLVELLRGLPGIDEILTDETPLPPLDYYCPLMSLPHAFQTGLRSIPSPKQYLTSMAEKRLQWSAYLGKGLSPRIGLVWSGSKTHGNDRNRSLPLDDLLKSLPPQFEYLSLQKEVRDHDRDVLRNSAVKHYGDDLQDFSDTAALCDLVDIVISVDTSVAHLAGALGKRTWILLPYVPDWRWLLDRDDSPWYESVTLYRQGVDRQYPPVLRRVSNDLLTLFSENKQFTPALAKAS